MREADAAVKPQNVSADNRSAEPIKPVLRAEPIASTGSLQDRNAPLLTKTSAYTCLESVSPAKIDTRGRSVASEIIRVDVAVSEGKEIYGQADGKRFSDGAQRDLLGYSFSTTGLFSSIARAVIAGNQLAIEPAGEFISQGEPVLRYNFHALPGMAAWTIAYGKESGHAAEEGWFLVDAKTLTLRRVFVKAAYIPGNLKLANLSALIDYEFETLACRRVLLPTAAKVEVGERSGVKRLSLLSFDHCRAFTAESTLSFDEPNLETQNNKMPGPNRLPDGVEVIVSLNSPVSRAAAAESDVLTATVAQPVLWKGRELIARGATVEGHIRPRRGENSMVIQLDRVQTRLGWAPFYAQALSLGSAAQAHIQTQDNDRAQLGELEVPGVAIIGFASQAAELPPGTQMLWKIEPLVSAPKDAPVPQLNTSMGLK